MLNHSTFRNHSISVRKFLPTLFVCVPVILFNLFIQAEYPPQLLHNFEYWIIVEPFYKTLSHMDKYHYASNIMALFSFSLITSFFVKFRYHILFYILATTFSATIIEFYINGVGMSIVAYGIVGLLSASVLGIVLNITYYMYTRDINIEKYFIMSLIFMWIMINVTFGSEVFYVIISTDIISSTSVPSDFSFYSSVGHILGYIFGFVYGTAFYIITLISNWNIYEINIKI